MSLGVAILAGCGYLPRSGSHRPSIALRLGVLTVRDPDAVLATEARAIILRAWAASGDTPPVGGPGVDVELTVPVDDAPPAIVRATGSGAEATAVRVRVHLRATWHTGGQVRELTSDGEAEAPVGVGADTVAEASHRARAMGLQQAARLLAEAIDDVGGW